MLCFENQGTFPICHRCLHGVQRTLIYNTHRTVYEQFSVECHKSKTKVITLTNHKGQRQSSKPIKTFKENNCSDKLHENQTEQLTVGFCFTFGWLRRWHKFYKPITKQSKTKASKYGLLSTLKWELLCYTKIKTDWGSTFYGVPLCCMLKF